MNCWTPVVAAFALLVSLSGSAQAQTKAGQEVEYEIAKGLKMTFCWIPAGTAQLGSPKSEQDYLVRTQFDGKRRDWLDKETETYRAEYKSKGFWLAKYPVTQEEYAAVAGNNQSFFRSGGEGKDKVAGKDTSRFPVEQVSWEDAQSYVGKLNDRSEKDLMRKAFGWRGKFELPHEDEWEYACRGGKGNKQPFYFGDQLDGDRANCNGICPYGTTTKGDCLGRTSKVGDYEKKAPHPWGLCDMSGNVWQLCENPYSTNGPTRVIRGGSCLVNAGFCRSAYRSFLHPSGQIPDCGFRLAVPNR